MLTNLIYYPTALSAPLNSQSQLGYSYKRQSSETLSQGNKGSSITLDTTGFVQFNKISSTIGMRTIAIGGQSNRSENYFLGFGPTIDYSLNATHHVKAGILACKESTIPRNQDSKFQANGVGAFAEWQRHIYRWQKLSLFFSNTLLYSQTNGEKSSAQGTFQTSLYHSIAIGSNISF